MHSIKVITMLLMIMISGMSVSAHSEGLEHPHSAGKHNTGKHSVETGEAISSIDTTNKILVLGDSLSAAYGIEVEQGWVALMQQRLEDNDLEMQVINASISGETTDGGLRALPKLLTVHKPSLVLIELGANDGLRGFPLPVIQNNLSRLVSLSIESGADVLLIGNRIPPNYGKAYSEAFFNLFKENAETFQNKLALRSEQNDIPAVGLVPFMLDDVAIHQELMQDDGLHPKANAQAKILDTIWKHLLPLL